MNNFILNYIFKKVFKILNVGSYSRNGRNSSGQICVFHRGGGNRRRLRIIDFYRRLNLFGVVYKILYDPNRTAFIGLIFYENGLFSYVILSDKVVVGSKIFSGFFVKNSECYSQGSALTLRDIPLFSIVNSIEVLPQKKAVISRSAGTGATIISKTFDKATLKLKSG
jgi:large subunit ribosomal protein L2